MVARIFHSTDLLTQFDSWADRQKQDLWVPYVSQDAAIPNRLEGDVGHGRIFKDDLKRNLHDLTIKSKCIAASLIHSVAKVTLSPLAVVGEIDRLFDKSISASNCLKNICIVPLHIIFSIFKTASLLIQGVNESVSAASIGLGFLAWHGGERLVRWIIPSPHTVLSNSVHIRRIVYDALGITLLAAAAVMIPVASIQMAALPIIMGSTYGTINNQFTVRECPEYYTMGHYYDGTDLKGHAIKTNNLLIKPIVTGCYATTMITKLAGVILAGAGTIPYTAAVLPVPFAGAMMGLVSATSLVAAHIFSLKKKNAIQKNLDAYSKLVEIEWNEANSAKTWDELAEIRNGHIERKRQELEVDQQKLEKFNQEVLKLNEEIESDILFPELPVKYITGWQANNMRNSVGYLFAGGGTLAIAVSTVFLRLFYLDSIL